MNARRIQDIVTRCEILRCDFAAISGAWRNIGGYTSVIGMFYPVPPYADVIGRYFTAGVRFKM